MSILVQISLSPAQGFGLARPYQAGSRCQAVTWALPRSAPAYMCADQRPLLVHQAAKLPFA